MPNPIQRREQLIRRIRKLPDATLVRIEEVVGELERARSELPKVFAQDNAVNEVASQPHLMEGCVPPSADSTGMTPLNDQN